MTILKRIFPFAVSMRARAIAVPFLVASLSFLALTQGSRVCQRPPSWKISQVNPMAEARSKGHVVILALLLAS
ncbi:hypothetical protein OS493_037815 [Desmophyllum pertusum]|uniref:Selenoprotein P N-terminal domain-containing protein n=1 Tax=Desmophyllum pertusum TaxID=174260 RepID=A0A9X0D075_9CNID|nr:hypothetical protein OS493_037815 [Desmophyllum pertusum]